MWIQRNVYIRLITRYYSVTKVRHRYVCVFVNLLTSLPWLKSFSDSSPRRDLQPSSGSCSISLYPSSPPKTLSKIWHTFSCLLIRTSPPQPSSSNKFLPSLPSRPSSNTCVWAHQPEFRGLPCTSHTCAQPCTSYHFNCSCTCSFPPLNCGGRDCCSYLCLCSLELQ